MKRRDYTGAKFGRWSVVGDAPDPRKGARYLQCLCDCGNTKAVYLGSLTTGASTSCGCRNSEMSSARRLTHGLSSSTTHNTWVSMKARCLNPASPAYKNYGARGISICEKWLDFAGFLADMGQCPEGLSLERINNDLGYEASNCKWATTKEQANNKRSNRVFNVGGRPMTISQIADAHGLEYFQLRARLVILGWPVDRAINEPSRQRRPSSVSHSTTA